MTLPAKDASTVALRCLCLELLHQRYVLELDDDPAEEREEARRLWLSYHAGLGIEDTLLAEEVAFLERPVGAIANEDDLDDLHGRASGALVLLWALGRLPTRPSFESVEAMEVLLADHGLLGDGSIAKAKEAAAAAALRGEDERDQALSTYRRTRGKAREVTDPDRIFAEVAVHHLTWIADATMSFDDDVAPD